MSGEVSFFELGVGDPDRARTFYGKLFGWEFSTPPGGAGWAVNTPNVPGGIHGDDEGASPLVFFRVDDLDAARRQVSDLGGEVSDIGGEGDDGEAEDAVFGRFAICNDDQGSTFGLHQPPG